MPAKKPPMTPAEQEKAALFSMAWNTVDELVQQEEYCDEENTDQEAQVLAALEDAGIKLDMQDQRVRDFCTEVAWAASELYNAEYAMEAPGSRASHRRGFKQAMAKAKLLLRAILA